MTRVSSWRDTFGMVLNAVNMLQTFGLRSSYMKNKQFHTKVVALSVGALTFITQQVIGVFSTFFLCYHISQHFSQKKVQNLDTFNSTVTYASTIITCL